MNLSGWITFKEIVDSIMLAGGDSSDTGQFLRLLNFAIKGYEQLRLHSLPATKPVTLPVSTEMRIVVLPDDYLKFVSIGVYSKGTFYEFYPKSDMLYVSTTSDGIETRVVPDYTDDLQVYRGYYSLDVENRRILIDAPLSVTEVLLNYTPTGVKMDGITYIPRMCREVIEAYVEFQISIRDKGYSMADRIMFEKEYLKAFMKFQGLQVNPDELFQEYYDHLAAGPKY